MCCALEHLIVLLRILFTICTRMTNGGKWQNVMFQVSSSVRGWRDLMMRPIDWTNRGTHESGAMACERDRERERDQCGVELMHTERIVTKDKGQTVTLDYYDSYRIDEHCWGWHNDTWTEETHNILGSFRLHFNFNLTFTDWFWCVCMHWCFCGNFCSSFY